MTPQARFQDDFAGVDGESDAAFHLRKSKSSQELRSNGRLSVDGAAAALMSRKASADFVTTTADGRLGELGSRREGERDSFL